MWQLQIQQKPHTYFVLQDAEEVRKHSAQLEGDLTETKHELLKIREMLELAEKVHGYSRHSELFNPLGAGRGTWVCNELWTFVNVY